MGRIGDETVKIEYISKRFAQSSLDMIDRANAIIDEYEQQGFVLTLRQLFYQLVSRDLLPNKQSEYKRLGSIMVDARNAGLVDWNAIEDRTRDVRRNPHWDSPSDILETCATQFQYDLWADQEYRPEVWIEKDALVGVFEPTCNELDVPVLSCRGYLSVSEAWAAGQRFRTYLKHGQEPVILHFGDHDPSGIDMTRDLASRLGLYTRDIVEVRRLALNMDQVEAYEPPPNPAKVTDSRFVSYVEVYGEESWELDALEPSVLVNLVKDMIANYRDNKAWKASVKRQDKARSRLQVLADEWSKE